MKRTSILFLCTNLLSVLRIDTNMILFVHGQVTYPLRNRTAIVGSIKGGVNRINLEDIEGN
jgi:hypothetical protein